MQIVQGDEQGDLGQSLDRLEDQIHRLIGRMYDLRRESENTATINPQELEALREENSRLLRENKELRQLTETVQRRVEDLIGRIAGTSAGTGQSIRIAAPATTGPSEADGERRT